MTQPTPYASDAERLNNVWLWRKSKGLTGKDMKKKFDKNFNPVAQKMDNALSKEQVSRP